MTRDSHFVALEKMYLAAPINELYRPTIEVLEAEARIEMDVSERHFHSAGAVHGSVYFKMLDDAAFFAANSLERDVFVLTTSFTTYLTKPISSGIMRAVGRVVNQNRSQLIAEAVVYDSEGNEIGRGNGIFVRSKMPLRGAKGYDT
ncbi:MAG: PaaI family thioesterase [Acidobacteriota bacterium]